MGTNFYYKVPLKKRDKENLHKMIDELPNDLYDIKAKLDELEKSHYIHLGKRSYGWQFLWDYHKGKFYEPTLKSIINYLHKHEGIIENEYGEIFTIEEFFGDEIEDCLLNDDKHCNARQYYQKHPEEPLHYNIDNHEFMSDGLRFSKDEDFS